MAKKSAKEHFKTTTSHSLNYLSSPHLQLFPKCSKYRLWAGMDWLAWEKGGCFISDGKTKSTNNNQDVRPNFRCHP